MSHREEPLDEAEQATLEKHRAILAEVEAAKARLVAEAEASSMIVAGLERRERSVTREQLIPETAAETAASPSDQSPMRVREAARRIIGESNDAWRPATLAAEIERRGWTIDSARPNDALRTVLLRMTADGEAVRAGRGLYTRPATDQSERPGPDGATSLDLPQSAPITGGSAP